MTWQAKLRLDYSLERQRTVARYTHEGPLRILQSLYPEGDAVCHNVLIHPPGGLVGGDTLALDIRVGAGAHGLITTPGATRFYRSLGPSAVQSTQISLSDQARLEWLPLENLCHNDCRAENRLTLDLAPGSEVLGWDITALGLPHAQQAFERGSFLQHLEAPGVWLERGEMRATDQRLMQGPAGLAGCACLGTLFFLTGSPIDRQRRSAALELAQTLLQTHALRARAGVTSPNERVLVVRALAPLVEPVGGLLRQLWAGWRQVLWQLGCDQPRIWAT